MTSGDCQNIFVIAEDVDTVSLTAGNGHCFAAIAETMTMFLLSLRDIHAKTPNYPIIACVTI